MQRSETTRTTRRRPVPAAAAVLTVIALLATQVGVLARLQATLDAPSPATGHASVIAQGVAEMPVDPVAWRVVADTADPIESAQPIERALGFVIAQPDGVQVADSTANSQERLAPGEASFVPEGAVQIRASLTTDPTSYLRVALVSEADANDPGSDTLVFGGEAFVAPSGQRDIDLVRDVLTLDENSALAGSEFPTLVIATAGELDVTVDGTTTRLVDGEAAEFTGDLVITGISSASSYVAGVIGPEVPVPPRKTGTVSLGVFLCPSGVTPSSLGDPIADGAADECGLVGEQVSVTLNSPEGDALTLDDAETVRDGVYAWTSLPFGDYSIDDATNLPAGASDPTYFDSDGHSFVNSDVSISSESPDVHINLFLFSTGSGAITLTVYNCPSGWSPESFDPNGCDPITSGFDASLSSGSTGDALTLADAQSDGDSFVWSGLGISEDANTLSDGYYIIDEPLVPDGFNAYTVSGTNSDGGLYVNLTPDSPTASITIFNYITSNPTGTITLDSIVCPSAESSPETCTREFGPSGISGILIQDVDGANDALSENNASLEGDGPYVWANVPLAAYSMDTSGLIAPDGYDIFAVVLTPDGNDVGDGFEISQEITIANIVVLLAPAGGGDESTPTTESTDSDSDGLTDGSEVVFGTDSADPDSDGDCHLDGSEIDAGTDPRDPTSVPAGGCDVS